MAALGFGLSAKMVYSTTTDFSRWLLSKELTSYEINGKPTIELVKGNKENGFVYKYQWHDPTYSRTLECANKKFNQSIRKNVIALASTIDAAQQ